MDSQNRSPGEEVSRPYESDMQNSSIWRKIPPPMNRRRTAFAISLFAGWLALAKAQDQGPGFVLQGEGGLITAFALDPSSSLTIYAATGRGLYKTADGGASWRR